MRLVLWTLLGFACRGGVDPTADKPVDDPDATETDTVADSDGADSDGPADTDRPVDTDLPPDTDVPADTDAIDTDPSGDADADTILDVDDLCPGEDDRVDLDADAVPDCAETMVPNAQLVGQLDPWHLMPTSTNFASAELGADDASGWAGSGSIHIVNLSPTTSANAAGVFSGCAAAGDVSSFDILYHYRVPSSSPAGTNLQLITSFDAYSDAACQAPWGSITPGPPALVFDRWGVLTIHGLQIPPQVHGVKVRVELYKPGTSASVPFQLDDVLLQPAQ